MNCPKCSNPVQGAFCSVCGTPVQAAPPQPPPPGYPVPPAYAAPPYPYIARVPRHVQTLGILWCVYGVYRATAGIFAVLFLMGIATPGFLGGFGPGGNSFLPFAPVMGGLAAVAGVFILLSSCLAFVTGYSLIQRKPWGRTLAIVAAILSLIKLPIGTALGIYTLWVLAPGLSAAEYDAIADHS